MAYGGLTGQSSANAENVSYNNKNTSTIIKSDNVQGAIDQLFTSVSEGKSLVAKAVTDKGVQTALDATFETIAQNVGKIRGTTSFDKEFVKIYNPIYSQAYTLGRGLKIQFVDNKRIVLQSGSSKTNITNSTSIINDFSGDNLSGNFTWNYSNSTYFETELSVAYDLETSLWSMGNSVPYGVVMGYNDYSAEFKAILTKNERKFIEQTSTRLVIEDTWTLSNSNENNLRSDKGCYFTTSSGQKTDSITIRYTYTEPSFAVTISRREFEFF